MISLWEVCRLDDWKKVLICEDSIEGIFTAVYDGWLPDARGTKIEIRTGQPENPELFCTYEDVRTDQGKSWKVAMTVRNKLGAETYEHICYAAVSVHPEKGTAIFRVLRKALGGGRCNRNIMEDLSDLYVNMVSKMHTKVWHEYHRFLGFVRFSEVGGRVLFSRISPENDILVMLAPHFENRFPNEHWMIYDERRQKVLLHPKRQKCTVQTNVCLASDSEYRLSEQEEYEKLWKAFCKSITIEQRRNKNLQQQLVPMKFRQDMTEFQ